MELRSPGQRTDPNFPAFLNVTRARGEVGPKLAAVAQVLKGRQRGRENLCTASAQGAQIEIKLGLLAVGCIDENAQR
jgi:hypothetical protein